MIQKPQLAVLCVLCSLFLLVSTTAFSDSLTGPIMLLLLGDENQKTQSIGSEGGKIEFGDQGDQGEGITVEVPPWAVENGTLFVVAAATDLPGELPNNNIAFAYELTSSHEGTFDEDIKICFSFDPSAFTPIELGKLRLYYFDENQQDWIGLHSVINRTTNEVCTEVDHFTKYGLSVASSTDGIQEIILLENWNNMADGSPGWWEPTGYVSSETLGITLDTSESDSKEVLLPQEYHSTDFIQVDIMLEDPGDDPDQRVNARVGGVWGNYKHATPDTYFGVDGNINMSARIEKKPDAFNPGSFFYRVICGAGTTDNQEGTLSTELLWRFLGDDTFTNDPPHPGAALVGPDIWYTATLEKRGTVLTCEIKHKDTGTVLLDESVDVGGDSIYEVGEQKALTVRFHQGSGTAVGKFDDVYVGTD